MWFVIACAAPPLVADTTPALALALPAGRRERWADVPPAAGFTLPVDEPDVRIGRAYGERGHLGLDLNARGACDDDIGVPVAAAATGIVSSAADWGGGWGNVVQVVHRADSGMVQTLYGHLDQIEVAPSDLVQRGQRLGTIGNAHGVYCAHLHFEIRSDPDAQIGGGYATAAPWYQRDPAKFLRDHAP